MTARIALVADLHIPRGAAEIPRGIKKQLSGADLIICAGDLTVPRVLQELKELASVEAVSGRNCSPELKETLPPFRKLQMGGAVLGITHGPRNIFMREQQMARLGEKQGCSFLIFGGTHRSFFQEMETIVLINPGSPTLPAPDFRPSMAWLYLGSRSFKLEFVLED